MCFYARNATSSRRHRPQRSLRVKPPRPLAMLDLDKPTERAAYDFLLRATSKHDEMWRLVDMRRNGSVLLCVVRWAYPENAEQPFSLAEVSLAETAVRWRNYATADAAYAALLRCCEERVQKGGST